MMEKLTITIELKNGILTAICQELNCSATGEYMDQAIENLQKEIDSCLLDLADTDPSKINPFIKTLYGGEGKEGWEDWLEQSRYTVFKNKLDAAFLKAYPKARKHGLILPIPYVFWDGGANYESDIAKQKAGYEGLIKNGKDDKDWVDFVMWITAINIRSLVKYQQKEQWEKMKNLGLPVKSFEEIISDRPE